MKLILVPTFLLSFGLATAWGADSGTERLVDGGFEALATGPVASAGAWHAPVAERTGGTMMAESAAAQEGKLGVSLKRAGKGKLPGVLQNVQLASGLYELTVQACGTGNVVLAAGANRRRLALAPEWNVYSLIFATQTDGDVEVGFWADGAARLDHASLVAADAERQTAWKQQEEQRALYGFVPAGTDAQRPPAVRGSGQGWAPPVGGIVWREKVVYYDATYDEAHIKNSRAAAEYLAANGFQLMNAEQLGAWLRPKVEQGAVAGTVLVLPMGSAPMNVMEKHGSRQDTLFRYVELGGRVLWLGEYPFMYCQDATSASVQGGEWASLLDVRGGWSDKIWGNKTGKVEITPLGKRWGFTDAGPLTLAVYVEDVTAPLSTFHNEDAGAQAATYWFKNFCPEQPWSGVIWALRSADMAKPEALRQAYRIALFAGEPVTAPEPKLAAAEVKPFELTVQLADPHDRSCYLRGESIPVRVTVKTAGTAPADWDSVRAGLLDQGNPVTELTWSRTEVETAVVRSLATTDYACRDYTLRCELRNGATVLTTVERTLSICPRHEDPTFFFGAWNPSPQNPYRIRKMFEKYVELGMHPGTCNGGTTPEIMDQALRYGRRFALRAHGSSKGPFQQEEFRVDENGKILSSPWVAGRPLPSLLSPRERQQCADGIGEELKSVAGYPALWPYAHTNDDFSVRYGKDYSGLARRVFKEKTGLDAPLPAKADEGKGIVPENDPWLQWGIFTTRDIGGGYNHAMLEGAQKALPGIKLGPVPGGMQIPLWLQGQYPPHHFGAGGFNLLYYYYYVNYWQPLIGALYFDEIARMANRDLEVWCTAGLFSADEPTYYRNKFFLHLAGGLNGFNYFTLRDGELRPRGLAEIGRIGRGIVEPYYPFIGKLRPRRHSVGLLLPYTQTVHEWGYAISAVYVHANLLAAHIDVEPTCEEEVMAGSLPYKTLLLWHVQWLRQAAADELKRFMAGGGVVLADASTTIDLPGMIRLPVDFAMGADAAKTEINSTDLRFGYPGIHDYALPARVQAIRQALLPYAAPTIDSPAANLVIREAEAGGVRYLWLVNVHTNEDYEYLRPRIGAGAAPKEPETATAEAVAYLDKLDATNGGRFEADVILPAGNEVLYDVLTGGEVAVKQQDGKRVFRATMKNLGGQLVALSPQRVKAISAKVDGVVKRGTETAVEVRVNDDAGKPVKGYLPLNVEVRTPAGLSTEWSGSYVATDGAFRLPLRPALNHPAGAWQITVKERMSGLNDTVTVDVK